jgi:hypothetical protein
MEPLQAMVATFRHNDVKLATVTGVEGASRNEGEKRKPV